MTAALIKKQFKEFLSAFFINKKQKKTRSAGAAIGLLIILIISYASLGFMFFGISTPLFEAFSGTEISFLPFASLSLIAFIISLLFSSFYANTALFSARDNELLLSMPIPPVKILIIRMFSVFVNSFITSSMVLIPTTAAWIVFGDADAVSIVFCVLNIFIFPLFVTACSCLLGFLIAYISSRFQRKNLITVFLTFFFLAVYYVFYFKLQSIIKSVLANGYAVAASIKKYGFFLYAFGKAETGSIAYMLVFAAITAAVLLFACFVISKSFKRITSNSKISRSKRHKAAQNTADTVRVNTVSKALLRREFKRFAASAAYLINVGLGIVLMITASVALIIFRGRLYDGINTVKAALPPSFTGHFDEFLLVAGTAIVCMISSTVYFTAASISIEGKHFWILRSSPIAANDIINAKVKTHVILAGIPALILSATLSFTLKADYKSAVIDALFCMIYVFFCALEGLILNIKMPKLDWTNENVPVKQGIPALIAFFGGWLVSIVIIVVGFLLRNILPLDYYVLALTVIFGVGAAMKNRYLMKNGESLFAAIK